MELLESLKGELETKDGYKLVEEELGGIRL